MGSDHASDDDEMMQMLQQHEMQRAQAPQAAHDGSCHLYHDLSTMEPAPLYAKPWAPQIHDSPTSTMAPLGRFCGARQPHQDWVSPSPSPATPATSQMPAGVPAAAVLPMTWVDSTATLVGAASQGGHPRSPTTVNLIAPPLRNNREPHCGGTFYSLGFPCAIRCHVCCVVLLLRARRTARTVER